MAVEEDTINTNKNNDVDNIDQTAITKRARLLFRGLSLAPMVRASTTPLRTLALQYGADYVYTEELVDRAILQTLRVENKELGTVDYVRIPKSLSKNKKLKDQDNRPCLILRIDPKRESGKLVCQLGTGEPELALQAAKHVYQDVSAIDINMGCPKKFSVSGGMGSALLHDPDRAARIISTLKKEMALPISCKIRLLKDTEKTVEFVEMMLEAGVDALAIHARRVGHDSTATADWKTLEEVLAVVQPKHPNFPFLVNGDFYDRIERSEFLNRTKARGVLLARPALYNTSTFLHETEPLVDKTQVVQEYLRHALRYDIHYKNTKYVICEMMSHRRTPIERVTSLPLRFPSGQTVGETCSCHDLESLCKLWNVQWESDKTNGNDPACTSVKNATDLTASARTMPSGDHDYDDCYFLGRNLDREEQHLDAPIAKRAKVEI